MDARPFRLAGWLWRILLRPFSTYPNHPLHSEPGAAPCQIDLSRGIPPVTQKIRNRPRRTVYFQTSRIDPYLMTSEDFRNLALALPDAVESEHWSTLTFVSGVKFLLRLAIPMTNTEW